MSEALVEALQVRAVDVPMAQPAQLAGGTMTSTPAVLIDARNSEGCWGHSYLRTYTPIALRSLARLVQDLEELVVGHPVRPAGLQERLPHTVGLLGTRGLVGYALAGLDMALWDLEAQAAGRSLAHVLGARRDRIPAYATVRSRDPWRAAEEAQVLAAQGVGAVKLKLGGQSHAADRELVQAVRSGAGPDVEVMGDFNQSLELEAALQRAEELDELGLGWIEEPIDARDLAGHARIAAALRTPVQLGENLEGPHDVRRSLEHHTGELLMLDAMKVGGVSGWMQAAAAAGHAGRRLSSHAFPEVSVHLLAASRSAHWVELIDHMGPIRRAPLQLDDGDLRVPRSEGVGLEWDERAVARYLV